MRSKRLESTAGCQIHGVYTGIAGGHIRSLNSYGIVAIRNKEVTPGDVERVIDAAQAVAIPADQKSCTSCLKNSLSMSKKG